MAEPHFADRLAALVEERRSRVVLGLDPDPAALWPEALAEVKGSEGPAADLAARATVAHCRAVIDAAGPACVAVKLQLGCFERLGAVGWSALGAVRDLARPAGLLVIADAKRGDVPVTARAYAQAFLASTPSPFGTIEGFGADAVTVNPLLGRDSLDPWVEAAAARGSGLFCLVNTSNEGAADLQDLDAGGAPLYERLAGLADSVGADHVGESGLSLVGAVTGATRPERLGRLRELMPRAIFLLPGVGAQGGDPGALGPAFGPHPAAGLVAASRSIVDAHRGQGGDPAHAAQAAAEELRATTWN